MNSDVKAILEKARSLLGAIPERLVKVDIGHQKLCLVQEGEIVETFDAGTSRFGVGNREGSFKTPRGLHVIVEKIGEGAPPGTVFRDRVDTGERVGPDEPGENLIVTRILRLRGLESGVNAGPGIDSFERCIYIHGTSNEKAVGVHPLSHGCVCMRSADIIDLFSKVEEGDLVGIY